MRFNNVLKVIICTVFISLLILEVIFIKAVSYDALCIKILHLTHKEHKLHDFQNLLFTKQKYNWLMAVIIGATGLALLLSMLFVNKIGAALQGGAKSVKGLLSGQVKAFRSLQHETKISLLLILGVQVCAGIYFIIKMPVFVDEAFTFVNFTKNGVLVSMSYYPAPNNHIFYSVLTNFTSFLPFGALTDMRLINLIVGLLSGLLFFKIMLRLFSERISLLLLALFNFSFMVFLYTVQARGYGLVLFFFLLMSNALARLLFSNENNGRNIVIYSISVILGFYTMPSFLYPFVTANIFAGAYALVQKKWPFIKQLVISNVLSIVVVIILYGPVIFINGVHAVVANKYTKSLPRNETIARLWPHILDSANWFFPVPYGYGVFVFAFVILLLTAAIIFSNRPKIKLAATYFLTAIIAAPILILLQSVIPFPRTWIYLCFPIIASVGIFLSFLQRYKLKIQVPPLFFNLILLLIMAANIFAFDHATKLFYKGSYEMEAALNRISLTGVHSVISEFQIMSDVIEYKILVDQDEKVVTKSFDRLSKDSLPDLLIDSSVTDKDILSKYTYQTNLKSYKLYRKNADVH